MTSEKVLVCVIHVGGAIVHNNDGSVTYAGGEAHLLDVYRSMSYEQFRMEVAEMCNTESCTLSFKYLLPPNKRTLITISNDKDLRRMVDFQHESPEVYVTTGAAPPKVTNSAKDARVSSKSVKTKKTVAKPSGPPKRKDAEGASTAVIESTVKFISSAVTESTMKIGSYGVMESEMKATPGAVTELATEITPAVTESGTRVLSCAAGESVVPLSSDDGLRKPAVFGENTITGISQLFKDVHEFRDALRKYAIDKRFAYEFVKNDASRVTAKCKVEGCQWRIHASKVSKTKIFKIKTINGTHTCEGYMGSENYPPPTKHLVASLIKEKLRSAPDYKTKEIVNDIHRDYGLKINYLQAWRGKEFAREQLLGKDVDPFRELSLYCERVMETNPFSIATLMTVADARFHRLFIAFHACLRGFEEGCRPLLFLHSAAMKLKHQGVLLAATSIDGDDGIFPVAFAIVEQESYDSWQWFLHELKSGLSSPRPITFVSDGLKGLKEVVPEIFGNSEHAFCLSSLAEKLKKEMKGSWSEAMEDALADLVYNAARACEKDEFFACIESIRSIFPEAAIWVMGIEPTQWANVFFKGSWYSQIIYSILECFDSWVSKAHDLSVLKLVDTIRRRIMELIYARWEDSAHWQTTLTPKAEEKLRREIDYSRSLSVSISSGTKFEVIDDHVNLVDLDMWGCTCRSWKITGLPCRHVIVSLNCMGRNVYEYCERYLTAESYRMAYSRPINPIPDVDIIPSIPPAAAVTQSRMPSQLVDRRPKKKRDEMQENGKRTFHCSRCKGLGHNRATCKAPV